MTTRAVVVIGIAAAVGVLNLVGLPLLAQQPSSGRSASVTTPSGIQVEEVHVGTSCVVIVFRGGAGSNLLEAVPCSN